MNLLKYIKISHSILKSSNLRGIFYCLKYKNLQFPLIIKKGGKFKNLKYLKTEHNLFIDDHAEICIRPNKAIQKPQIVLGKGVFIGRYNILSCINKIILEENVLLAPFVFIIDNTHNFSDPNVPIKAQGVFSQGPIRIKKNSWIGANVQILGGVTIGRNCIIGAGSIVNSDIPDYSVAIGRPAKVIKIYNFETNQWERV